MLTKAIISAVVGLAFTAPAALAENVYFSVGIDGRATAGVSLDDWEPSVTRVELVRGGAVVAGASADTPGLPFAYIRSGTLQTGDVLNVYRGNTQLGAVPYTGLPTVGADACAGRSAFTVTYDEGAQIEDASYYVPGSGGYGSWARSIWTRTNPATVTIDRPMVQGGVVDVTTWRRTTWRGNKRLDIYSQRDVTVPACPVTPPAQPPVGSPGPGPVVVPDTTPAQFATAFTMTGKQLGKLKLATLARKRSFALNFVAPKPGTVKLNLTTKAKGKTVALGAGSAKATKAGTVKVTVKLTKTARTLLKRSKRLTVTLAATFTPTGGQPIQKAATFTLKK